MSFCHRGIHFTLIHALSSLFSVYIARGFEVQSLCWRKFSTPTWIQIEYSTNDTVAYLDVAWAPERALFSLSLSLFPSKYLKWWRFFANISPSRCRNFSRLKSSLYLIREIGSNTANFPLMLLGKLSWNDTNYPYSPSLAVSFFIAWSSPI